MFVTFEYRNYIVEVQLAPQRYMYIHCLYFIYLTKESFEYQLDILIKRIFLYTLGFFLLVYENDSLFYLKNTLILNFLFYFDNVIYLMTCLRL